VGKRREIKGRRGKEKGKKRKGRDGKESEGRKWREGNGKRDVWKWGKGREGKGKRKKGKGMGRKGRRFYFDQHKYIVVYSGTKTLKTAVYKKFSTLN